MQTLLQRGNLARRAVRSDDYLFLRVVKRIEGVEELFLSSLLAGHELDIVHQQHINRTILFPKCLRLIVANSVDQFVHEPLRRQIGQSKIGIALLY